MIFVTTIKLQCWENAKDNMKVNQRSLGCQHIFFLIKWGDSWIQSLDHCLLNFALEEMWIDEMLWFTMIKLLIQAEEKVNWNITHWIPEYLHGLIGNYGFQFSPIFEDKVKKEAWSFVACVLQKTYISYRTNSYYFHFYDVLRDIWGHDENVHNFLKIDLLLIW